MTSASPRRPQGAHPTPVGSPGAGAADLNPDPPTYPMRGCWVGALFCLPFWLVVGFVAVGCGLVPRLTGGG